MVIVAGHVTVEPQQREAYLVGCVSIVRRSRSLAGCLDFAIAADLIDPGRVNIYERWESQAAVESARSSAPGDDLSASEVERVHRMVRTGRPLRSGHDVERTPGLRDIDAALREVAETLAQVP